MDPLGGHLDEMRAFLEVARRQSFSAAARALGLTSSSVSKQVARLEERLGAQLLRRTTRRVSLTEAGNLYAERADRILSTSRRRGGRSPISTGRRAGRSASRRPRSSARSASRPRCWPVARGTRSSASISTSPTASSIWWPSASTWRCAWPPRSPLLRSSRGGSPTTCACSARARGTCGATGRRAASRTWPPTTASRSTSSLSPGGRSGPRGRARRPGERHVPHQRHDHAARRGGRRPRPGEPPRLRRPGSARERRAAARAPPEYGASQRASFAVYAAPARAAVRVVVDALAKAMGAAGTAKP